MKLKSIIHKVHLWLGFASGLVVFIVSITGCLYAFQYEILEWTQPFRRVQVRQVNYLPPSKLRTVAEGLLPGKHIHAVSYGDEGDAAQVIFFSFDPEYYYIVYVNPYTAEVLSVVDMEKNFFHIVLDGHYYLWLPPSIGKPIVASATLIFVVMLLTGLILWARGVRRNLRPKITIRWKAKWRRLNFDLHNVVGFYVMTFGLVLAVTGLVWGFEWFATAYYTAAQGEKSLTYTEPGSTPNKYSTDVPVIDQVYFKMKDMYPNAASVEVHVPLSDSASIAANANPATGTYWKMEYHYFDQSSLEELPVGHVYGKFSEADTADKIIRLNYDIHTGAIGGLMGKIVAFVVSLLCASLPVTGVMIWWGRRSKSKLIVKNEPKKVYQSQSKHRMVKELR